MPEPRLHLLDVRAVPDQQRRVQVPQRVQALPRRQADRPGRRRPIPPDFLTFDVTPYLDPDEQPPTGWAFPDDWWREALAAGRQAADLRSWARFNGYTVAEIHAARRRLLVVVTPAAAAVDSPPD
jgi:hypothetical protein